MKTPDHKLISPTALFVADYRRYTDITYSREIAEVLNTRETVENLLWWGDVAKRLDWLAWYLEVRFKCITQELERLWIKNILEIASWIAPRWYIMTEDSSITYIDTDLPDMIDIRNQIFENILWGRSRKSNHISFSLNVLDRDEVSRIISYFNGEPFAVVHEWLLSYFSRDEKKIMAENIYPHLKNNGGVWITPDLSTQDTIKKLIEYDKYISEIMSLISWITERNLSTNVFENETEIIKFYQNMWFKVEIKFRYNRNYYPISSIESLWLDPEFIIPLNEKSRIMVMSL